MELSREQVRLLLYYEYRSGVSASAAVQNICQRMGENTVSLATAKRWFSEFKQGRLDLRDKPIPGRPVEIDVTELQRLVESEPRLTSRELAEHLKCSHVTVTNHLHELGKSWKYSVWIPHELTPTHLQTRMDICLHLLTWKRNTEWLRNLITGDEKWVTYINYSRHRQWLGPGETGIPTSKINRMSNKIMLSVWWGIRGVIYWELLPANNTVTAEVYCNQLEKLAEKLRGKYDKIYFLHDNARPHVATRSRQKLQELGWITLPHPPYSPDMAPTDYHLFRSLSTFLDGKTFVNQEDVQSSLTTFFNSHSADFYTNGIQSLPDRWCFIVNNNGAHYTQN